MAGKIFIESRDVIFSFDHLYLVYQDPSGSEFVIRGGPENNIPPFFGNIEVEAGVPIAISEDRRVDEDGNPILPEQRNQTLVDLDGREAEDVWKIALQQAQNIDAANLNYNAVISAQNSNSTISSVLNSIGIDVTTTLPAGLPATNFLGVDNLLAVSTTLKGTAADDIIFGYSKSDTLNGQNGNDILRGRADNDTLYGGLGNDQLYGGSGSDKLSGNSGNDQLWGQGGNDTLWGGQNNDKLYGGSGDDQLIGGRGGTKETDLFGQDTLSGGSGNDQLWGEGGDDLLYDGLGNDKVYGGSGSDKLYGGGGYDTLVGGKGNSLITVDDRTISIPATDTFVINDVYRGEGYAQIQDFFPHVNDYLHITGHEMDMIEWGSSSGYRLQQSDSNVFMKYAGTNDLAAIIKDITIAGLEDNIVTT